MESFSSDKLASLFKVLLFGGLALVLPGLRGNLPADPTEVASFESAPSELSCFSFILLGR